MWALHLLVFMRKVCSQGSSLLSLGIGEPWEGHPSRVSEASDVRASELQEIGQG